MSASSASSSLPTRAVAVPVAATPRVVDPEVVAAQDRYFPMHRGVDPAAYDHVVDAARTALDGLEPVVLVNRRVDSTLRMLDRPVDEPIDTIHTSTPGGLVGSARRIARRLSEQWHGTFGTGPNRGRTVFGSTRFVPVADARLGAEAVFDALARQGEVGVGAYGPVALLVRSDALDGRTTFAARDTAKGVTRVGDRAHLPEIVAERIERGAPGAPSFATLARSPATEAAALLRTWLTGDGLASREGYIEAQLRSLTPSALAGLHVSHAYDGPVMKKIDPGALPDAASTERLRAGTARLGIAFSEVAPRTSG
jgi:hypothetical protein